MTPLWWLLAALSAAHGAHILAVYTVPAWSHWNVFRPLMWELADRGHHVTLLTPHQEQQPHRKWTLAPVSDHLDLLPGTTIDVFSHALDRIDIMRRLMRYGQRSCERLMQEPAVQELLTSQPGRFHLVIVELFFNDCLLALAHRLRAPVVGTCAFEGAPWMDDMVGNPRPPAVVPDPFLDVGALDSLLERAANAAYGGLVRLYRRFVYLPAVDAVVRSHAPDTPPLASLERTTTLVMVNRHLSFNAPRPLLPGVVGYGGMHIRPPKSLPQDIQKFLDDALHGAIYFSLGTNVMSTLMKNDTKKIFTQVFSRLKQKVLWKFDEEHLPDKPDNVMVGKWLPQQDVLAHENIGLFITHGGLMSIQEAIYHGVPVVGFPVFADQFYNLNRAQLLGFGIKIYFTNITVESLTWAITEMFDNSSYREAARQRSQIFHDSPRTPMEEAVYWIEYVIRHRGSRHFRSAALDLTWYQLLLLDVIGVAFLLLVVIFIGALSSLKLLCILFKQPHALMNDSKKLKTN